MSSAIQGPKTIIYTGAPYPTWRSLPVVRTHLPTGLTQATNLDFQPYQPGQKEEETSFLSTSDLSFVSDSVGAGTIVLSAAEEGEEAETEVLSQYYEHSFAVHEDVPSSQVLPADSSFSISSTPTSDMSSSFLSTIDNEEGDTTNYSITSTSAYQSPLLKRFKATPIADLREVPNASYLRSIEPQTMTVNLLIGIIALPAPRTIITRKGQRTVSLLELIVGDESRAGFGVNIWLPPPFSYLKPGEVDLREEMVRLRVRDVVLMRNVALTSFRGQVYGQSLRRGMTRVELVYRFDVADGEERGMLGVVDLNAKGGGGAAVEKVKRIRDWILGFVGGGDAGRKEKGKGRNGAVQLPPDTQGNEL
ncbi:MAG: hypothetical protein Q9178_000544 [Gyalolechia marmorata]